MTFSADYLCHTVSVFSISLPRSDFPTSNFFLCFQARIVGGLLLSSQCYDSLFSHLLEINNRRKPPWILDYIHHSPVSIMDDKDFSRSPFRKSDQYLTLGIVDVPIALPPAIVFCAAPINRCAMVITTVNPRTQNLSALIGQVSWVWDLAAASVGRSFRPGKVQFKFTIAKSANLVHPCGLWSFNAFMLTIHRWYLTIIEEERTIFSWFRFSGIPSLFLTNPMVRFVGSKIGPVTKVDFEENVNITAFVRVQMDWICDNSLRFRRNFQFSEGENTIISLHFTRLRNVSSFFYGQQVLGTALALYGWESLDTSESGIWDGLVMIYAFVEEIFKDEVSQHDLGTEVLVPLYLHFRIRFGHIGFHATFCDKRFSHKLLHTNRNKEKSNMKLDNNGSYGRLASKATLRKASSNSLLLYFLLVYGTYICVCNNCVSIILYAFVITLLD